MTTYSNLLAIRLAVCVCLLALLAPGRLAAAVYRWVDAAGVVHYSETPPEKGPYTRMNLSSGTTGANAGVSGFGSDQPPASAPPAEDTQAKADRAERCAKARERIQYLEERTAHRLMVTGPDGQPARMTEEQFNDAIADAKKAEAGACK